MIVVSHQSLHHSHAASHQSLPYFALCVCVCDASIDRFGSMEQMEKMMLVVVDSGVVEHGAHTKMRIKNIIHAHLDRLVRLVRLVQMINSRLIRINP